MCKSNDTVPTDWERIRWNRRKLKTCWDWFNTDDTIYKNLIWKIKTSNDCVNMVKCAFVGSGSNSNTSEKLDIRLFWSEAWESRGRKT